MARKDPKKSKRPPIDPKKIERAAKHIIAAILGGVEGDSVTDFKEMLEIYSPEMIKKAINYKDNSGQTPLMVASAVGKEDLVKTLIKLGANKDARDESGKTAEDYLQEAKETRKLIEEAKAAEKEAAERAAQEAAERAAAERAAQEAAERAAAERAAQEAATQAEIAAAAERAAAERKAKAEKVPSKDITTRSLMQMINDGLVTECVNKIKEFDQKDFKRVFGNTEHDGYGLKLFNRVCDLALKNATTGGNKEIANKIVEVLAAKLEEQPADMNNLKAAFLTKIASDSIAETWVQKIKGLDQEGFRTTFAGEEGAVLFNAYCDLAVKNATTRDGNKKIATDIVKVLTEKLEKQPSMSKLKRKLLNVVEKIEKITGKKILSKKTKENLKRQSHVESMKGILDKKRSDAGIPLKTQPQTTAHGL
jgi:hypothetical protein